MSKEDKKIVYTRRSSDAENEINRPNAITTLESVLPKKIENRKMAKERKEFSQNCKMN